MCLTNYVNCRNESFQQFNISFMIVFHLRGLCQSGSPAVPSGAGGQEEPP